MITRVPSSAVIAGMVHAVRKMHDGSLFKKIVGNFLFVCCYLVAY